MMGCLWSENSWIVCLESLLAPPPLPLPSPLTSTHSLHTTHTFHTQKFPILDTDGVPTAVGAVATDVTELTRATANSPALWNGTLTLSLPAR